jgi:hypothetical protein
LFFINYGQLGIKRTSEAVHGGESTSRVPEDTKFKYIC